MQLVRHFRLFTMEYNVLFKAPYISTKSNFICDFISPSGSAGFKGNTRGHSTSFPYDYVRNEASRLLNTSLSSNTTNSLQLRRFVIRAGHL